MATTISTVDFCLTSFKKYKPQYKPAEGYFYDSAPPLMGTLYTVEGVNDANNQPRKLSMAELVMVVCLARAADKEKAVINLMKEMSDTTEILKGLTDIETKLLDGKKLSEITGEWYYNGTKYTNATEFLGAVGVLTLNQSRQTLVTLSEQLKNSSAFDLTGPYYFSGTTYNSAYQLLRASGCVSYNYYAGDLRATRPVSMSGHTFNQTAVEAYEDALELINKGSASLSDSDRGHLWAIYGINNDVQYTSETMGYVVENMFYNAVVSRNLDSLISATPAVVGGTPSTDQLITDIESKMDSLNSFSQEKMIELQSETNKRDQAYDMITNILKSMNTVQVGIVNNM